MCLRGETHGYSKVAATAKAQAVSRRTSRMLTFLSEQWLTSNTWRVAFIDVSIRGYHLSLCGTMAMGLPASTGEHTNFLCHLGTGRFGSVKAISVSIGDCAFSLRGEEWTYVRLLGCEPFRLAESDNELRLLVDFGFMEEVRRRSVTAGIATPLEPYVNTIVGLLRYIDLSCAIRRRSPQSKDAKGVVHVALMPVPSNPGHSIGLSRSI